MWLGQFPNWLWYLGGVYLKLILMVSRQSENSSNIFGNPGFDPLQEKKKKKVMSLAVLNQMLLERYPQTISVWKYFLVGLNPSAFIEKGKIQDHSFIP